MQYNVIATLREPKNGPDDEFVDWVMESFAEYHPVVSGGLSVGQIRVVMTIEAEGLTQASRTGALLVETLAPVGMTVIETAEFDRTAGLETLPALVTAAEAAEVLGISRQAVTERIRSGTMPATRVGSTWVIPAAVVPSPDVRA